MITDGFRRFLQENSLQQDIRPLLQTGDGNAMGEDARAFLQFLYLTLPYADIGGYDTDFFAVFAKHGEDLRRTHARCREIPESVFLWYVLHPRVNNEELSPCRRYFYDRLAKRVEGLTPVDAVKEVNRWCAEHVTYRSTDERTASAMSVYRTGYGRCGEESVFAVNAFRSVGIPARQVYAPWWSHCDDNHAWVEVWVEGQWCFLGACEPEPVLNRGWFTAASSRAMLIHTKRFSRLPQERIQAILEPVEHRDRIADGMVLYDNVTGRYAETCVVTITVRDAGKPVPFAHVSLQVLNMASFRNLVTFCCDETGRAEIRLGRGSVRVCASDGKRMAAVLADTGDTAEITADLQAGVREPTGSFRMRAPKESFLNATTLNLEQKKIRGAVLEQAAQQRAQRQHLSEIPETFARIALTLPQKDRDDIPTEILMGHQAFMKQFEGEYPPEIFENYLLCPRIGHEPLSRYAERMDTFFSGDQKAAFRAGPHTIWDWICGHIVKLDDCLSFLPAKPEAVLKTGYGTAEDCRVLFAAIARSCGVPAAVCEGRAVYYRGAAFYPADGSAADRTEIKREGFTKDMLTASSLCLSAHLQEHPVSCWETETQVFVSPAEYLLTFMCRLPSGDLLANSRRISVGAGQALCIQPDFPGVRPEDMLQKLPLKSFALLRGGELCDSAALIGRGKRIFIWLRPGEEPTEHILGELLALSGSYKNMASQFCLIVEKEEKREDALLSRMMGELGIQTLYTHADHETQELISRRLYMEPERLPLILLMDEHHAVLYAAAGYNVGTAELLLNVRAAATSIDKGNAAV